MRYLFHALAAIAVCYTGAHAQQAQFSLERLAQERAANIHDIGLLGGQFDLRVVSVSLCNRKPFDAEDLVKVGLLGEHLRILDLSGSAVTDEGLCHLDQLVELTQLELSDTLVSDASFSDLAKLSRLRSLSLAATRITGKRIYELGQLKDLTFFNLANSMICREGWMQLKTLRSLKVVSLAGTQIDNAGVTELRSLASLERLGLRGTKIDGNAGLGHAVEPFWPTTLQKLRFLHVGRTEVNDQLIDVLPRLRALEELNIEQTRVTPAGLARLAELGRQGYLKTLTHLTVSALQLGAGTKEALEKAFPEMKILIVG